VANFRHETPPFDQGLYLLHLNKGRAAVRRGGFREAMAELRAALAVRPDDDEASNLLSVACFKLGDLEEAEKITRRLMTENPESEILRSNLGVIHVKRGQLDDAERELRRAVELKPDHRKSHLYLGFVYRQKKKLGLAAEHFRYAGADRLAAEIAGELQRTDRDLDGVAEPTTQKLRIPKSLREGRAEPAGESVPVPESARPPAPEPRAPAAPGTGEAGRIFRIHESGTVEIRFDGELLVRRGTVASYSGKVAFAAEPRLAGTTGESLLRARGRGTLFLAVRGRRPLLFDLQREFLSAEASRILAIGPSLSFRYEPIHDFPRRRRVDVLRVFGRGSLVLCPSRATLPISVSPEYPLNVSSRDLVGWTGNLVPSVLPDRFLDEVMLPDREDPPKIRFEGEGEVITETPA
jgi:hypothetical protein